MMLRRLLRSAESVSQLDPLAARLHTVVRGVLRRDGVDHVLRGEWIGHPVHPLLVALPIGAWLSTPFVDALPGQEVAAKRLAGLGVLGAVPAVVTGWADWSELDVRQRRVGLLHAVSNATATACFAVSYQRRSRGAHRAGAVWALVGLLPLAVGGALGGHLAYAQGAGVYRWQPGTGQRPASSDTPAPETSPER